jgi:hypothetical protein
MLDQVTRTCTEYPVLPGTTEAQGVLWYMSTILLTAFGFSYEATSFRPPFNHEGREHIPQERPGATVVLGPARCVEAHRGMERRAYLSMLETTQRCERAGVALRLMYTNSTLTHTNNSEQT